MKPTAGDLDFGMTMFADPKPEPHTLSEHDLERVWMALVLAAHYANQDGSRDEICALERLAREISPSRAKSITVTPFGS